MLRGVPGRDPSPSASALRGDSPAPRRRLDTAAAVGEPQRRREQKCRRRPRPPLTEALGPRLHSSG